MSGVLYMLVVIILKVALEALSKSGANEWEDQDVVLAVNKPLKVHQRVL